MIAIVFNPTARGDKAQGFLSQVTQFGDSARLLPTQKAGHAIELASQAVRDGATTVVAAGGDGTVNEVLNGIARIPGGCERTRLAILPLGTVNVFAKELGIPLDLPSAWETARSTGERRIDLPCLHWEDGSSRWFAQMAGAGVDSLSIGRVRWSLKKRIGPLAYVWACLEVMRQPRPHVVAELPGERLEGALATLGNGRFLGGRFPVYANASLEDGQLDLVVLPRVTWPVVVRVFWHLLRDTFDRSADAQHRRVTELRLSSPDPLPIHVEGDNVGQLPVTLRLHPGLLRVAVPLKK